MASLEDIQQKYRTPIEAEDLAKLERLRTDPGASENYESYLRDIEAKQQRRESSQSEGNRPRDDGGPAYRPPPSVTQSWSTPQYQTPQAAPPYLASAAPPAAPGIPDWYQQMFTTLQEQLAGERQQREADATARAQQQAAYDATIAAGNKQFTDLQSQYALDRQQREEAARAAAAAAAQAEVQRRAERDQLFGQLQSRAQQSLNVQASDPLIAQQTGAYSAQQERARRNYLADLAERGGALTNLQGEERLSAERLGAQTAQYQADLMGRELQSRREEIAGSLQQMQGLLTGEQQQAMQRELALLDNAIKQRGLDVTARGQDIGQLNALLQGGLTARGQDIDWQQGLHGNQLQWQIEQLRQQQANRDLSLRAEDRAAYWDALRSGLL
jgi:hypothetical protein